MDFTSVNVDQLNFGSNPNSFGPDDVQPDFGDQFNGKLYKPYNKREKLGKLIEFNIIQTTQAPVVQQVASKVAATKAAQAQATNDLAENIDEMGFTSVEDKSKQKIDKKKPQQQQLTQAQKAKLKA